MINADQFNNLFDKCLAQYKAGNTNFNTYYDEQDLAFLASIGYKVREFFDFIEDYGDAQVPTPQEALLIAQIRQNYLNQEQNGEASTHEISHDDLPVFGEKIQGISYLPRILVKATAKLKGELNPDIMYGCGGDRNFISKNPAYTASSFLQLVWDMNFDGEKVAEALKNS